MQTNYRAFRYALLLAAAGAVSGYQVKSRYFGP